MLSEVPWGKGSIDVAEFLQFEPRLGLRNGQSICGFRGNGERLRRRGIINQRPISANGGAHGRMFTATGKLCAKLALDTVKYT